MSTEISTQHKKQIIENNILRLQQEEFDLAIRKDVYKEVGLDDKLEEVAEALIKTRKLQKSYEGKLKELKG